MYEICSLFIIFLKERLVLSVLEYFGGAMGGISSYIFTELRTGILEK